MENTNYLCDHCQNHWNGEAKCPKCGEVIEIRKTMSYEEAKERGLL